MSELRPLMTRNESWQMFSGYALAVAVLVLWPDKESWTRWTVLAIGLGGLLVGSLAWIVLAERRLPRLPSWSGTRQPRVHGALAIYFLAFGLAFIVSEILRIAWPDQYEVFPESPPPAGSGDIVWDFTTVEVPVNSARRMIAYFAVAFGGLTLGSGLLQSFHAWRARRRDGKPGDT